MEITAGMNNYLTTSEIPFSSIPFPYSFQLPFHELNGLISSLPSPVQTTSSPLSNNSTTSDESEENKSKATTAMIDERRQRRMISNRESARRSRMRKQRHLDELWSQVIRLRNENHCLIDRLNSMSESHERMVKENSELKEEASELRQMISTLQLANTLRDLDEEIINCDSGSDHDHHDQIRVLESTWNQQHSK